MSNHIIGPPPHPRTPVVDTKTGLINYEWHKWFTRLAQHLNNEGYFLRDVDETE